MGRAAFIGKAVAAGAALGGLAGYGEAAFTILFSKLYFTAPGKIGLMVAAAATYAAYGMAAAAVFSGLLFVLRTERSVRAAASASALSIALLYSVAILLSSGVLSRGGLFSVRFFLWGAGLLSASIIAAYLFGAVAAPILRRRGAAVAAAIAFLIVGVWSFLPRGGGTYPAGDMPDIVLVTIDTIRADRIGCYGHDRIETPTLDRLAAEGVLFENAISQIPTTNPSHLSLLSSRYPHQTGVIKNWYRRPPGLETIVDEFKKRGYLTAAFVSAFPLDSRFGFAEGFDVYDDDSSGIKGYQSLSLVRMVEAGLRGAGSGLARNLELFRDARETTDQVRSWLKSRAESPFFLWVHYFDPHQPYTPPPPYSGMYYEGRKDDPDNRSMNGIELPRSWPPDLSAVTDIAYPLAQYDAEITYTDAELGRLVEEVDSRFKDVVIVVVGDHGESLTEHGNYFTHGEALYQEQVRVPLIIRWRGRVEPSRVPSLVENVDIAPTIMEMAGLGVPGWCRGESLVALMRGEARRTRKGALSETWGKGSFDIAYMADRYKLIVKQGEEVELYDLESDPGELRDISGEREDLVRAYWDEIRSILGEELGEATAVMDYETEEKLRSLGYIQ